MIPYTEASEKDTGISTVGSLLCSLMYRSFVYRLMLCAVEVMPRLHIEPLKDTKVPGRKTVVFDVGMIYYRSNIVVHSPLSRSSAKVSKVRSWNPRSTKEHKNAKKQLPRVGSNHQPLGRLLY